MNDIYAPDAFAALGYIIYAWPVIAGLTALVALSGWLQPATRQRRDWRIFMSVLVIVLLVDTLVAAPLYIALVR